MKRIFIIILVLLSLCINVFATVSSTTNKLTYTGDGNTTVFPYTFKIYSDTDLEVTLVTTVSGVETTQTLTTDYTVSGAGVASGGNVTMLTAPESTEQLVVRRVLPLTQGLDLVDNTATSVENYEDAYDKLTMMVQEIDERVDRSITAGVASTIDGTLPSAVAGYLIGFNSSGDGLTTYATQTSASTVTATGSTTARTLAARWADFRNVKDFGATGDGSTDDTAAIQAAITAERSNGGGTIYLPTGVYIISDSIIIYDGIRLIGAGDSYYGTGGSGTGTVIRNTSNNPAIRINGANGYGFELANFHIYGNNGTDDGIYLVQTSGSIPRSGTIKDISIKNVGRDGVRLASFSYVDITDVHVNNSGQHGFNITPDVSGSREYLYMTGCTADSNDGNGLNVEAGSVLYFNHCDFAFNNKGVYIATGTSNCYFNGLSVSQNDTYNLEIYAVTNNLTRLSFRDTFIYLAGNSADERGIYIHRDAAWEIGFCYFDFVDISTGGVAPTYSIEATDAGFNKSHILHLRDGSGGTVSFNSSKEIKITESSNEYGVTGFTNGDTTPSVFGAEFVRTQNSAPTTITNFDDGYLGQKIYVWIADGNTTIDFTGTTLKGNVGVDWSPGTNDSMICVFDGTNWLCDINDTTP